MRVLVTGSRDWEDGQAVYDALDNLLRETRVGEVFVVVHGGCPSGADHQAQHWVDTTMGVSAEVHHADWDTHGRSAGPYRNRQMVESGVDVCLAFIRNGSRGATGCSNLATVLGVPVRYWRQVGQPGPAHGSEG